MAKKKLDGFCPICGELIEVVVTAYKRIPFINGKNYEEICFTCDSVPKMHSFDELKNELIVYNNFDKNRLNTLEEMISDGFTKKESQISIKAVKRICK